MSFQIAYSVNTPSEFVEKSLDSLSRLTGSQVERRDAGALAGPNDVLQLWASASEWIQLSTVCLTSLTATGATSFANEFGKQAGAYAFERFKKLIENSQADGSSPTRELLETCQEMTADRKASATLCLPIDGYKFGVGIDISNCTQPEIIRRMLLLAHHASELTRIIEPIVEQENVLFERNTDLRSIKADPLEDGSLLIEYQFTNGSPKQRIYIN